jgi:hypothetical protein
VITPTKDDPSIFFMQIISASMRNQMQYTILGSLDKIIEFKAPDFQT